MNFWSKRITDVLNSLYQRQIFSKSCDRLILAKIPHRFSDTFSNLINSDRNVTNLKISFSIRQYRKCDRMNTHEITIAYANKKSWVVKNEGAISKTCILNVNLFFLEGTKKLLKRIKSDFEVKERFFKSGNNILLLYVL